MAYLTQIERLGREIEEAAFDPSLWPAILDRTAEFFGGFSAMYYGAKTRNKHDLAHLHLSDRLKPYGDDYRSYYFDIDVRSADALRREVGEIASDYDYTTEREIERSEFYDWLQRQGHRYAIGTPISRGPDGESYFAVHFTRRQGPTKDKHVGLMARLYPFFTAADAIARTVSILRPERDLLLDAFELLDVGIGVLDRNGEVTHLNGTLQQILGLDDGLSISGRQLIAALPRENRRLRTLLRELLAEPALRVVGGIVLDRPSGRRGFSLTILRNKTMLLTKESGRLLLLVRDLDQRARVRPQRLAELFNLSQAQAELAADLAAGRTIASHAARKGISVETARWQSKQVFSKLQVTGQTDLVRLIFSALGQLSKE